jgi:hypothetical protein
MHVHLLGQAADHSSCMASTQQHITVATNSQQQVLCPQQLLGQHVTVAADRQTAAGAAYILVSSKTKGNPCGSMQGVPQGNTL